MTCAYCGSRNGDGEHRCLRCGRRPTDTLTHGYRVDGALAAQLQPVTLPEPPETVRTAARPNLSGAVQRNLFQDRPAPNVIPFDSYAPAPKPGVKKPAAKSKTGPRRSHKVSEDQTTLDFLAPAPVKARTLESTVDSYIFCEEPVAHWLHRSVASAMDWIMVLIAYGMFLGMYHLAGGPFEFERIDAMVFGGAFVVIALTYFLLWAIFNRETPGMRWAHLRLTTFDGFRPNWKQRLARFAGSCLSVCTVVGLLWSLADEESLAWQDHISGTFPTPRAHDAQVFQRS